MNIIADRLFALLLGWTKALFNGLWNLFGNSDGGAIGFVQRFWLPIVLILVAFGVVTDYVVWLIRWRPYFVWRTWLRNLGKNRRERLTRSYMEDLDHSPLDLPGFAAPEPYPDNMADGDAPVFFDFDAPADQAGDLVYPDRQFGQEPGPDSPYVSAAEEYAQHQGRMGPDDAWDPLQAEPSWMSLFNQARQRQAEVAAAEAPQEAWADVLPEEDEFASREPSVRRRRSDRSRRKPNRMQNIRDAIFSRASDEPVDSLPPPVSQKSAFRAPYIPRNYRYNSGEAKRNEEQ